MSAISDLVRTRPAPGAPHADRVAWHVRKAEALSRIADEAAETPGLVDPAEARSVAEAAWRQVDDLTTEPATAGKDT